MKITSPDFIIFNGDNNGTIICASIESRRFSEYESSFKIFIGENSGVIICVSKDS